MSFHSIVDNFSFVTLQDAIFLVGAEVRSWLICKWNYYYLETRESLTIDSRMVSY